MFHFTQRCDQCGKTFSSHRHLQVHRRHVHSPRKFKCHHCTYNAKTKQHMVEHMKVHLKAQVERKSARPSCGMCSHRARDRKDMLRHYTEDHGVALAQQRMEFGSFDEFMTWKSGVQRIEQCSYVADGGARKTANKIFRKFRCFRDGFYSSRGSGKRRLKVSGSCKINGICPAGMSCSEDRHSGAVSVCYSFTHVGHGTEVGRLNLPAEVKDAIAQRIAADVPFDVILEDVREMGLGDETGRAILVTRKDLWNIKRDYKQKYDAIHRDDQVIVEACLSDASQSPPSFKTADLTPTRDEPQNDFRAVKNELMTEFSAILEAATSDAHFDLIRRQLRPLLSTMKAINLDQPRPSASHLRDSSKNNPRVDVPPAK